MKSSGMQTKEDENVAFCGSLWMQPWRPPFGLEAADLVQSILNDIAIQSEANPSWLDISAAL